LLFHGTFSTTRLYRAMRKLLLKIFMSDRKLKICCLEVLVKMYTFVTDDHDEDEQQNNKLKL